MAAKVFQSSDLLRHIYSFGDPDHRMAMRDIAVELQSKPYDFADEFFAHQARLWPHEQDMCIVQYFETLPHDRLLKLLTRYKRCYCCKRHNTQKPMFHHGQLVTFTGVVNETNAPTCRCCCRHYSRLIMISLFTSTDGNALL